MAQYTFSFKHSELERIPLEFRERTELILAESKADAQTKELLAQLMAAVQESVEDLAKYAKDGLKL